MKIMILFSKICHELKIDNLYFSYKFHGDLFIFSRLKFIIFISQISNHFILLPLFAFNIFNTIISLSL